MPKVRNRAGVKLLIFWVLSVWKRFNRPKCRISSGFSEVDEKATTFFKSELKKQYHF